jgi:hypothetical protein
MPEDYTVEQGDCISSIAFEHGFFWVTLWNHPQNSGLKDRRKDPNVLMAGDIVFIPDLRPTWVSKPTEARHRFTLKGVPARLRLRLIKNKDPAPASAADADNATEDDLASHSADDTDQPLELVPRANVAFALEVDGTIVKQGKTDSDGRLEVPLPPNAQKGRLILNPGLPEQEVISLELGGLDPVDEISGVRRRLSNLKYHCLPTGNEMTDDLAVALADFQGNNGLKVTGAIDNDTKDKLKALHGC